MLTFRGLFNGLNELGLQGQPVIAHASLAAFGPIHGGADTLLGALLSVTGRVIMPTFTYKTMLTPEIGPDNNAIVYGSGGDANRMAEFFTPEMPADRLMGIVPETLRRYPRASRSSHPILSFTGVAADDILQTQTLADPLAPIGALLRSDGWVLLLGVDHTVNTSIHYAEQLAGRKPFVRWALTLEGVVECPGWPGCSLGFAAIAPRLEGARRTVQVGNARVEALPLAALVHAVRAMLAADPLALLCNRPDCERCGATRAARVNNETGGDRRD